MNSKDYTVEQVQAERAAGQLLSRICHEAAPAERARLLSLAFWHAGRAAAFDDLREAAEVEQREKPRGTRR